MNMATRAESDMSTGGDNRNSWDRVAILVAGDCVAFILFALLGRQSHAEAVTVTRVIQTAAPFIIGWLVAATVLGAFGDRHRLDTFKPGELLGRTGRSWLLGWGLSLLLRRFVFGAGVAPSFALVALIVNGILLLGWRGVVSTVFWRH